MSAGSAAEQLPLPRQGNYSKVVPAWDALEWRTGRAWFYPTAKMENVQRGDKLASQTPKSFHFQPRDCGWGWFLLWFLDSQELFILQLSGRICRTRRFSVSPFSVILGFYNWIYVLCGSLRNTLKPKIIVFIATQMEDFFCQEAAEIRTWWDDFQAEKGSSDKKILQILGVQIIYLQQC